MSIQSQLKGYSIKNLKTSSGKTYTQVLYEEANRLRECIQFRLDNYLSAHPPILYKRTNGLQSSLKVDDFINISVVGNGLEIKLFFDDNAYHKSGDGLLGWWVSKWYGTGETVNTAYLLNYGYRVKKDVWFKDYENFGYREGGYFVEDGIDDFKRMNPYNITIQIEKPNGYIV